VARKPPQRMIYDHARRSAQTTDNALQGADNAP